MELKKKILLIFGVSLLIGIIGLFIFFNSQNSDFILNSNKLSIINSHVSLEILNSLQDYNTQTVQNPDGSFTSKISSGHINYKNITGGFESINLTYEDNIGYWSIKKASYNLYVNKTFGTGDLIRFDNKYEGASHSIYYNPHSIWWINKNDINDRQLISLAQNVNGVLNTTTNSIYYKDAFGSGLDFEITKNSFGFTKEIIIQNKTVAGTPPSANHRPVVLFKYTGSGLSVKANDNASNWNGIDYYDSLDGFEISEDLNPNFKSYIQKAYVKDSNDSVQQVKVFWHKQGATLFQAKVIPLNFMTNTSTVYPVRADTVTSITSGAGDGYVSNAQTTWAVTHDQSTGTNADSSGTTVRVSSGQYPGGNYDIRRGFIPFNTSSLPDDASITGADFSGYVSTIVNGDNDGNDFLVITEGKQASPLTLATSDFSLCGDAISNPTEGSPRVDYGDLNLNVYNNFTLNSNGRSWINATGYTKLCIREGHDILNDSFAGGLNQYNQIRIDSSETSTDPTLNITYFLPSCTYSSGNWNINASDNCIITSNIIIDSGSNITCTGTGSFTINYSIQISNWNYKKFDLGCYYKAFGNGGFY